MGSQQDGDYSLLMSALHRNSVAMPDLRLGGGFASPPPTSAGMHGDGLWGAVGHTHMQCVSC